MSETFPHIGEAGCQREDCHDFAGNGDIESGAARDSFLVGTESDFDFSQKTIVGIHHAPPSNAFGVDIEPHETRNLFRRERIGVGFLDSEFFQSPKHGRGKRTFPVFSARAETAEERLVALTRFVEDARINRGGEEIVRCGNRVNISGEMKIEILHRHDL